MLRRTFTPRFNRELETKKREGYNMEQFKEVVHFITHEEPLPEAFKEHLLHEEWAGYTECHIEDDWLLIYKINKMKKTVVFHRTGSHSELFTHWHQED
ncbi:MAG: type II toxin-antitoxin system YafQ family toxin [Spirochaetaceae bacterium]|jgi:mRNA interferase YafQ|nr:type II toxin-antitoxin system YafQ family toxin [Spirochaetaceae bacterium]